MGLEEWEFLLDVNVMRDPMGQALADALILVREAGYTDARGRCPTELSLRPRNARSGGRRPMNSKVPTILRPSGRCGNGWAPCIAQGCSPPWDQDRRSIAAWTRGRRLAPGTCLVSAADINVPIRRSLVACVRPRATVHGGIEL